MDAPVRRLLGRPVPLLQDERALRLAGQLQLRKPQLRIRGDLLQHPLQVAEHPLDRGALNYSTDLFDRGTVVRMLGHLARVLEQVAADADVRLSRLELLGQAERALVLEEWNRTDAEYAS